MSTNLLVWIILAPLLGAILNGGLYFYNIKKQKISENYFAIIGTLTPLISFLITLSLFLRMLEEKIIFKQHIFTWLNVENLNIDMAFLGDNLSIFMSMFVTFVARRRLYPLLFATMFATINSSTRLFSISISSLIVDVGFSAL